MRENLSFRINFIQALNSYEEFLEIHFDWRNFELVGLFKLQADAQLLWATKSSCAGHS